MEWPALLLLGAYHGINPAMGWLFAVALGMQRRSGLAVWGAVPPLALGHALAVGGVLLVATVAQLAVPLDVVKLVVGAALITLGAYRFWRHRHPRFGGMQVGFRDLTVWSFLMASAHGAGLMVVPFVMNTSTAVAAATGSHSHHAVSSAHAASEWAGMIAVGLHTIAYLAVTAAVAWVVYEKVGLRLLRTAWFNMDGLWAGALVITGVVMVVR
jgi:hypothetical protein